MSEQIDPDAPDSDGPSNDLSGVGPTPSAESDHPQRGGFWFWSIVVYFVLVPIVGLGRVLSRIGIDTSIREWREVLTPDASLILILSVSVPIWLFALALGSRRLVGKRVWPPLADTVLDNEPHLHRWIVVGLFLAPAAIIALTAIVVDWVAVGVGWNPNASPRLACMSAEGDALACTTIGELASKVVYESLDLIPLVRVNRTLGWSDPIPDPTAWLGWLLIAMKSALVVGVIWSIKNLIEASKATNDRAP